MSVTQFGIINTCWFEYAECTLTIPTYVGVDPWGFVEWREVLCDFLANYRTILYFLFTLFPKILQKNDDEEDEEEGGGDYRRRRIRRPDAIVLRPPASSLTWTSSNDDGIAPPRMPRRGGGDDDDYVDVDRCRSMSMSIDVDVVDGGEISRAAKNDEG